MFGVMTELIVGLNVTKKMFLRSQSNLINQYIFSATVQNVTNLFNTIIILKCFTYYFYIDM